MRLKFVTEYDAIAAATTVQHYGSIILIHTFDLADDENRRTKKTTRERRIRYTVNGNRSESISNKPDQIKFRVFIGIFR